MSHFAGAVEKELGHKFNTADFKRGERVVIQGLPSQGLPYAIGDFIAYRTTQSGERRGVRYFTGPSCLGLGTDLNPINPYTVQAIDTSSVGFLRNEELIALPEETVTKQGVQEAHLKDLSLQRNLASALLERDFDIRVQQALKMLTQQGTRATNISLDEFGQLVDSTRRQKVIDNIRDLKSRLAIKKDGSGGFHPFSYQLTPTGKESIFNDLELIPLPKLLEPDRYNKWQLIIECLQGNLKAKLASAMVLWTDYGQNNTPVMRYEDIAEAIRGQKWNINRVFLDWRNKSYVLSESLPQQRRQYSLTKEGVQAMELIREGVSPSAIKYLN